MATPTIAAKNPVENMVLGKNFLEKAGSLEQAQTTLTQVASTPTCPSGTCPHSVGKELNVPGA
jgi:hypothetical protein